MSCMLYSVNLSSSARPSIPWRIGFKTCWPSSCSKLAICLRIASRSALFQIDIPDPKSPGMAPIMLSTICNFLDLKIPFW
ncbi:hypothetical protein FKM82_029133 [Ascaphus truei]